MPINVPDSLPAAKTLTEENIFIMQQQRAAHQDIRPLRILILNLMPKKIETETQLLRLMSNSPLQIEVELLQTVTHQSKNTSADHLFKFYKSFDQVKESFFDGLIVTGAPVEQMDFEDVDYWNELTEILDWAEHYVFSHFYICWGAQAALHHFYGINKMALKEKLFGVFEHKVLMPYARLLRGFDDSFHVPHSRHTTVARADIDKISGLDLLAYSDEAGVYLAATENGRKVFATGHSEYDPETLKEEYERDIARGLDIAVPQNYYPRDDALQPPLVTWRGHAHLLFSNWLNYAVYQQTPYSHKVK